MLIRRIILRAKTLQTGIFNVTVTGRIKNSVLTLDLPHEYPSSRARRSFVVWVWSCRN